MLAHKQPNARIHRIFEGIDTIERPQLESSVGLRQKGIYNAQILLSQQRTGGIQQLAANPHTPCTLAKHGKLKLGQVAINLTGIEPPRDLGVTAHGSHAGAGRIDKYGVEQFTLKRTPGKHPIQMAGIASVHRNIGKSGRGQSFEIGTALSSRELDAHVPALQIATECLAAHHIRFSAAPRSQLEAGSFARGDGGNDLGGKIRRYGVSAREHARRNDVGDRGSRK